MSDSWDDYAAQWDVNPDAIAYAEKAFKTLVDTLNPEGLRILDFGCGTGLLTELMAPLASEIVALDTAEKMIGVLDGKNLANVATLTAPLSQQSIAEHPLLQGKFDLVVASSVCGFLPDYVQALLDIKSILAPNGVFVQWDWFAPEQGAAFGMSQDQVESGMAFAGFEDIQISQPFSLTSSKGTMAVIMAVAKN